LPITTAVVTSDDRKDCIPLAGSPGGGEGQTIMLINKLRELSV